MGANRSHIAQQVRPSHDRQHTKRNKNYHSKEHFRRNEILVSKIIRISPASHLHSGFRSFGFEVVELHDFGHYETLLEVGVYFASGLWRLRRFLSTFTRFTLFYFIYLKGQLTATNISQS
jgi:hypothetical protein